MSTLDNLRGRLNKVKIINDERLERVNVLDTRLVNLFQVVEDTRNKIETNEFISRTLADYYKISREENLNELANKIGNYMTDLLNKPYNVEITILKKGQYDYLDMKVNGVEPASLSGGEKQVLSLLMIAENTTQPILILDETVNSLDPITLERVLQYLKELSKTHQIFFIELDDYLDVQYDYIADGGGIIKYGD